MQSPTTLLGVVVSAFVIGLSGAMMPGPLLAVTITESSRRGAMTGPLIVFGHMLLEALVVAAVVLGLAWFLQSEAVVATISFAGGAVMAWMGLGMVLAVLRRRVPAAESATGTRLHPVAAGIVVSLSNPYWSLWWATTGIACLAVGMGLGVAGVFAFFAGHILADLAWYTLVSVGVARGRRLLSDAVHRGLILACGAALLLFGAWFFARGAKAVHALLG